jgi:hypothetical protein
VQRFVLAEGHWRSSCLAHAFMVHLRARCRRQVCVAESERRDCVLQPQPSLWARCSRLRAAVPQGGARQRQDVKDADLLQGGGRLCFQCFKAAAGLQLQ